MQIKLFDPNTNSVAYLEQQDYVKYLRILIDKNLSWKYHIDYVASKISRTIGINYCEIDTLHPTEYFTNYVSIPGCPVLDIRHNHLGTGCEAKLA